MLFHGCAVIRALNCNGHGNNGWWSIRESCSRCECGQHYNWKCGHKIVLANRIKLFQDPNGSTHRSTQVPENTTTQVWYCEVV
jgi:hypothetical protein